MGRMPFGALQLCAMERLLAFTPVFDATQVAHLKLEQAHPTCPCHISQHYHTPTTAARTETTITTHPPTLYSLWYRKRTACTHALSALKRVRAFAPRSLASQSTHSNVGAMPSAAMDGKAVDRDRESSGTPL